MTYCSGVRPCLRLGVCRAAPALAVALLAGCYTTQPVTLERAAPAQPVRLWVGQGGASALAATVGPGASLLDGEVLSRDDTAVTIRLRRVTRSGGGEETFSGDLVSVRLSAIDSAVTRRFDRRRSLTLAAGMIAGAWLVRAFSDDGGFLRTSIGKPGGTQ